MQNINQFQYIVDELLFRNKSIIDLITKYQNSNARVNRDIIKAVTSCGCIEIHAKKQLFPDENDNFESIKNKMENHIRGNLCDNCRDNIEKDIGENLFFLTCICNTLGLNLQNIIKKETERMQLLGKYTMR